ncbi:MAG: hypothetical protein ACQESK_07405 [Bacteroidota bacterium]
MLFLIKKHVSLYPKKPNKIIRFIRSKWLLRIVFFVLLTVLTQVGGIIYALSIWLVNRFSIRSVWKRFALFFSLYFLVSLGIVPHLASFFGREKITHNKHLKAHSLFYVLTNRNYVTPELNSILNETAAKIATEYPGIQLIYLDANFPFIDGFPLLPHRYHNDGKKIDITFIYKEKKQFSNLKPSLSGYGVFENPIGKATDYVNICKSKGYAQYDFTKYVTMGLMNPNLQFSNIANKFFVDQLINQPKVETIFIEPHLTTRLQLESEKLIFHGCGTVRHDDHIHVEVQ